MAEYFADISALGNEYQAYTDVPTTWAVPQDGSGRAGPGHAAAVPVAEVTFAAVPTTGACSVYGVTVTLTGVLSAASTAAAATALASSINATTTATGATVCQALLPLNRFVYARVKPGGGANDSIVQIMSRIAGADLNYNGGANASARVTNTFNNTAMTSPVDFAGGADGPFAYMYNVATVFGKSAGLTGTSLPSYGLLFNGTPGPSSPGLSDLVHVRTKRSGSDLTDAAWHTAGTMQAWLAQRNYLFDNGTVWSGDNGVYTATFKTYSTTGSECAIYVNTVVSFESRSQYGFVLQVGSTSWAATTFYGLRMLTNSFLTFRKCKFQESSDNIGMGYLAGAGTVAAQARADLSDSMSVFRGTGKRVWNLSANGTANSQCVMNGHVVLVVAATGTIAGLVSLGTNGNGTVEWIGGSISDSNGIYKCTNPVWLASSFAGQVVVDGVVGITDAAVGFPSSPTSTQRFLWNSPEGANKAFRLETPAYSVDWKGDGTFPYCGAAADLRGVNWSHRVTWTDAPSMRNSVTPLRLSRFYRSVAATKTITLELYIPDASTIRLDELVFAVSYMDSTDVWRNECVGGVGSQVLDDTRGAVLSSSTASWTANGVAAHSAKKLELTTAYPIKSGSEIVTRLSFCAPKSPAIVIYVSPELGVA